MSESTKKTEHQLLQTGALVEFRILDTHTKLSPDGENVSVRVDIILGGDEDDAEPADVAEWGAFGFLFVLAALSFHDARPRGLYTGRGGRVNQRQITALLRRRQQGSPPALK